LKTFGTTQGTWWEHNTEEFCPDIPLSPKGKRRAIVSSAVSLAACANSIPKTGSHLFWPYLLTLPKSLGTYFQNGFWSTRTILVWWTVCIHTHFCETLFPSADPD
jgi:hypothetical protein